jgi:hypothetical protein
LLTMSWAKMIGQVTRPEPVLSLPKDVQDAD